VVVGSSLDFMRLIIIPFERLMHLSQQHVLLCPNQHPPCGEQIVLPLGSLLGISPYQPYWPTDSGR
jgi:hypothetical protein